MIKCHAQHAQRTDGRRPFESPGFLPLGAIGVCLRSSTSPAWPVPTAGGKSIYNYYEYDLIQV